MSRGRPKKKATAPEVNITPVKIAAIQRTTEDIANDEIKMAHEKNLPDPDFDFREIYHKGDIVHYIRTNNLTGDKQLLELNVRTIYARSLVAWEEHGCAYVIGYDTKDWIFWDRREAEVYFKSMNVEAKYAGGGALDKQ